MDYQLIGESRFHPFGTFLADYQTIASKYALVEDS
jgi:hypothetical protein